MDSSSESMSHAAVPGFDTWLYSWVQHPASADHGRQQWQLNWMGPITRQTGTEFLSPCLGPGPTLTFMRIWGVTQQMADVSILLALCFSTQLEKKKKKKKAQIIKPPQYWNSILLFFLSLTDSCLIFTTASFFTNAGGATQEWEDSAWGQHYTGEGWTKLPLETQRANDRHQ